MSVTTSADRHLEEAKEHLKQAYIRLQDSIDPDVWGSDEFCEEHITTVEKVIRKISKIRRKLN